MKKILLLLTASALLAACAQGVDAAKRLEKCVVYGNQDNNCEISTLDGQHATDSKLSGSQNI